MRVRLKRSAKADIETATVWYESQRAGLGAEFVERVREAINDIAENPEGYAKVIDEARKINLRKFPYSLFYIMEKDAIVIACLHAKRNPALAKEAVRGVLRMPDPE